MSLYSVASVIHVVMARLLLVAIVLGESVKTMVLEPLRLLLLEQVDHHLVV